PLDPERISIALANLVSNAIRHTPAGGKVTLAARRCEAALSIEVADTGEGIDPADLHKVFDRAVSGAGPESRKRHGLGLTIAREIVLQHGGELTVASAPGKGSVFTLSLPLGGEQPAAMD
ncbi:MAG: ATP-binding protein, partial [Polyangiaceae bacterium]|nr:ATP-binding protein [Polyangiaceae bacterium]